MQGSRDILCCARTCARRGKSAEVTHFTNIHLTNPSVCMLSGFKKDFIAMKTLCSKKNHCDVADFHCQHVFHEMSRIRYVSFYCFVCKMYFNDDLSNPFSDCPRPCALQSPGTGSLRQESSGASGSGRIGRHFGTDFAIVQINTSL